MAVELRCPECKKKLRLKEEPEPDSEVECPSCGHVFACNEHRVLAGGASDDDAPRKKKPADEDEKPGKKGAKDEGDDEDEDEKDEKKKDKAKPKAAGEKKPKKRRAKKRKTSTGVIVGIIAGVLLIVGSVGGVLIWFFTKKSSFQEMITYLPDDCDEVFGLNVGHLQKYPEFYKSCEGTFANTGFKKAGDAFSKALGQEFNDTVEYVVQGTGRAGGAPTGQVLEATVLRTKAEFDQSLVGKIPGAKKGSASGVDYYSIPDIPELGYPQLRVFAPTNRVVVFCRGDMPQAKFNAMVTGNRDNMDATPFARGGPMAKQTIRGTVWKFIIYGRSASRPAGPKSSTPGGGAGGGGDLNDEDLLKREIAELASSAQGSGYKASVGSREIRGEWVLWYKDDGAKEMLKKWKEKEWVKDEEKEPPKFLKAVAQKSGIGKTAMNVVRDNLSFKASGETFSIICSAETKLLQNTVGSLVGSFAQKEDASAGGGGGGTSPRRRRYLTRR